MQIENKARHRRVLVLRSRGSLRDISWLVEFEQQFETIVVEDVEQALQLLSEEEFDAVISQTSDFLPLERASVSHQAVSILNTIGEGVCIAGRDGSIMWSNHKMEGFPSVVKGGISQHSREAFAYFERQYEPGREPSKKQLQSRKYSFTEEETERYFEIIITPMLDRQGRLIQVAAVVWESTASRRLQQQIDAIDKAGRELVRLEAEALSTMTTQQRIQLLQDKIIRYARQLLHFDHFVVRLLDRRSNKLEVLLGVGLPRDEETEIFANSENNGITGYVAATGRSYICNNPAEDPHYLPGLDGVRSTLTVPLRLHDKVIGTLNVESEGEAFFGEDDRQVAEIFGRYVAIALNILDLLVVERYQTTGKAIKDLSHQLTTPLSDIITEASSLMEDYIGHDELRLRLQAIIDHVGGIKQALKIAIHSPPGILGTGHLEKSAGDQAQLQDKRVLVVDDEEFIRQTIAEVLSKFGCRTDTAADGRQAKEMLRDCHYDLVISDIKMPNADGYEIFAAARAADKKVPVILMTGFGYDPNHSIVRANREGLYAVLYKPFKVDQLLTDVHKALKLVKS